MLLAGQTFSESYPAQPESVPRARSALAGFARQAGADEDRLEVIRLCASEAVTNAVVHAYAERSAGVTPGTISVSATYVPDELWLFVADDGAGLRVRRASPGLGLGLALIAQLCDDFQILSRGSGGTELRMLFRLSASGADAQLDRGSLASAAAPA